MKMKVEIDVPSPKAPKQPRQPMQSPPRIGKSPLHDSHVRMQRDQEKFNALQEKSIRNFMVSNRAIRQMSDEEKAVLKQKLMQAKTQEQLIYLMRKERAAISDTLAQNRRLTREVEKRNVFQQRMNSSVMQMVGTLEVLML